MPPQYPIPVEYCMSYRMELLACIRSLSCRDTKALVMNASECIVNGHGSRTSSARTSACFISDNKLLNAKDYSDVQASLLQCVPNYVSYES